MTNNLATLRRDSCPNAPFSLSQLSARSNIWPHNSQFPKKSLRAERNPSVDPMNTTFNNNNVNGNNNNNDRDDNRCTSNNSWRGQALPHPAYNDEKMTKMRRSYRYVPPAPARYPHASTAACDRYDQLGLVLRGNIMLSSTYRENNGTEFRRSYTQVRRTTLRSMVQHPGTKYNTQVLSTTLRYTGQRPGTQTAPRATVQHSGTKYNTRRSGTHDNTQVHSTTL